MKECSAGKQKISALGHGHSANGLFKGIFTIKNIINGKKRVIFRVEYSKPNIRCGDWKIMNLFGKNGKGVIGVLIGCTSMLYAAGNNAERILDVIIRDFQPTHSDFENFSEESVNHQNDIRAKNMYGFDDNWATLQPYHNTCANGTSIAS